MSNGKAALELYERGLYSEFWEKELDGTAEFMVLSCAALVAVHEKCPDYDDFKQMKDQIEQAEKKRLKKTASAKPAKPKNDIEDVPVKKSSPPKAKSN